MSKILHFLLSLKQMIKNLDNFVTLNILTYLTNEDIYMLKFYNIFNDIINDIYFQNYLKYRKHPITFNSKNRYCFKCNIGVFKLGNKVDRIYCKHIN